MGGSEKVHNSRQFLVSNVAVGTGTLLSRVTGFGRILALAHAIGLSGLSDVYNTANTTPNIIYELMLGGVLSATLLPSFVRLLKNQDHRGISAIFSMTAVLLAVLTVVMMVAAPLIIDLYSLSRQDQPEEFRAVGVQLVRFFMPQIFFYGLISLASAFLNAQHKFALPAFAPILNNVIVIAMLLALPLMFGPTITLDTALQHAGIVFYLGLGTSLGITVSALALIPAVIKCGVPFRFIPEWTNPAVKSVLRLSGWTLGYAAANQAALYLVSLIALHNEGWMTAYQTAFAFFVLPHGLLAMTITTTFMPRIAREANAGTLAGMGAQLMKGLRLLMLLMIPASVGYMMIAKPLLVALLNHGQFSLEAAHITGGTLAMFAVGLFPFSAYLYLLRGFYALSDTRTPFQINLVENALNVVLAVPLVMLMGVQGLALAYSVAYCVSAGGAYVLLNRRLGRELAKDNISTYFANVMAAACAMAACVCVVMVVMAATPAWMQVAVSVGVGAMVYGGLALALGLVRRTMF